MAALQIASGLGEYGVPVEVVPAEVGTKIAAGYALAARQPRSHSITDPQSETRPTTRVDAQRWRLFEVLGDQLQIKGVDSALAALARRLVLRAKEAREEPAATTARDQCLSAWPANGKDNASQHQRSASVDQMPDAPSNDRFRVVGRLIEGIYRVVFAAPELHPAPSEEI